MSELLKINRSYFIAFLLFILSGGIGLLLIETGDLLIWFSEHRTYFWNQFFAIVTQLGEEPVYLILTIAALFYRFRFAIIIPLTGFIVMAVAYLLKYLFAHPRPSVYFYSEIVDGHISVVDGVQLLTGYSSFPSGHTMSAFTLYTLLALIVSKKHFTGILLFTTALLIGLSRVYLVQHFLKDIYLGAIVGIFLGIVIYAIQDRLPKDANKWYNKRFVIS
ncbi:MAG: phosphatase PAP2 family protein [Bacteroidota bacterium]